MLEFDALEQFPTPRGALFSGFSPWDLRDRASMAPMIGQEVRVTGAGQGDVYRIRGFETFATFHGPSAGGDLAILAEKA
jgi:hypothetical protein